MTKEEMAAYIANERGDVDQEEIKARTTAAPRGRRQTRSAAEKRAQELASNYMRIPEAAELLHMSNSSVVEVAKLAGAYVQVRKMTFIRLDLMIDYFEKQRIQQSQEYSCCIP